MPVLYDGYNFVPAPFVNIQSNWVTDQNDENLFPDITITLNGTIVPTGITPGPDVTDQIVLAQKEIENAVSNNGKRLEAFSPNGGPPIDFFCTVENVNFQPAPWTTICNYTITFKSRAIEGTDMQPGVLKIASKSENWQFNENGDGTTQISHSVSAVGLMVYESEDTANDPLQSAKNYCESRLISINSGAITLPSDAAVASGVLTDVDFNISKFWNRSLVEGIGHTENSWQVTENFIYNPVGNYFEEYDASVNQDIVGGNVVTVTINGTIIGFADNIINNEIRLANAQSQLATIEALIYSRLTPFVPVDFTLNPTANSIQNTYDRTNGVVQYSRTYSAKRGTLISGAIDENIDVSDTGFTDVFAQFIVPNRANGPIIQYLNTVNSPQRSISISASLSPSGSITDGTSLLAAYLDKPDTDFIIEALVPSAGNYYVTQNTEDWNPMTRRYNRVMVWTLDPNGSSVDGLPNGVNDT